MKRLIAVGLAALLAACGDTPTQVPAELDVDAQFAAGGADVYQNSWDVADCYVYSGGTYCYAYKGMVHQVATPSGNFNYFYKEDGSWSETTNWGYSSEGEWAYDNKWHTKKGQPQVYSWDNKQEWTYTYAGTTYGCSYLARYHYANGKVTKDIYDYGCTPV